MKKISILFILILFSLISFGQYTEINNGESGLSVRTKMNTMFSQLYNLNLTAQFSNDNATWHNDFVGGDIYIRFSSDLGTTWTDGTYIFDGINFVDSLNLNNNRVTNIATATDSKDAVNLQQLNDSLSNVFLQGSQIDSLLFSTDIADLVHQEGKLYYDSIRQTLNFYNSETDIMLNIGEELWSPIVHNHTGATIGNGKVVYISGSDENNIPDIRLADKDSLLTSRILGITTHEIESDGAGRVTWFGYVSGNFSTFTKGELVYLSDNGELTNTIPTNGAYVITIGRVIDNSVDGQLFVSPLIAEHTAEVDNVKGWPQTDKPTISFNNASRNLKITPSTGTTFYYYQSGIKYISEVDSIAIPDTEGAHIFYYVENVLTTTANPTAAQTETIIRNYPIVAYVYWDATSNQQIYLANETHTIGLINGTIHAILHFNFGAQYQSGFEPANVVTNGDGSLPAHAQFGINSGGFTDEDLYHSATTVASTTGLPIFYKSGANGDWRKTTNSGYSFTVGAGVLPQFNQWTGATWQLTEVTSGNFMLIHVFALNDQSNKIVSILGEAQYSTITLAQEGANSELLDLQLDGLPAAEIIPIATFVLEGKTTFTNAVNARYRVATPENDDYIDWRNANLIGFGGSGGSPAATVTAAAVTFDNSTSGLTATNVQDAIDEVVSGVATYTDEKAQDAVGGILSNAGGVTFAYNDATPSITASFTEVDGSVTNENNNSATFNETTKIFSIVDDQGTVQDTIEGFLITESDPIFAADSSKILHLQDTISLVATQYDLSGYVSGSNSTYYIQNQTATDQSANARISGYFDASSFKQGNTTLKLNSLKSGAMGTSGQFAVGAGTTSDFTWTSPASINISGFNNNANFITTAGETDQIFASDSAKLLHWSDTVSKIATQYDLIGVAAGKQAQLDGTGFVKASGTTISYDNNTYYYSGNSNTTGVNWSANVMNALQYNLNGANINTAGTLTNIPYYSKNQVFTGENTFSSAVTRFGSTSYSSAFYLYSSAFPQIAFITPSDTRLLFYNTNNLYFRYNGTDDKVMYHAGNSNLSSVNWAANNLTAAGTVTAGGKLTATTGRFTSVTDSTGVSVLGLTAYGNLTTNALIDTSNITGLADFVEDNAPTFTQVYPGAGIPLSTGSAWGTSITNNSTNWNTAYNNSVVSLAVTGTTTKTITATQQDGGTVTANFTDLQGTSGAGDLIGNFFFEGRVTGRNINIIYDSLELQENMVINVIPDFQIPLSSDSITISINSGVQLQIHEYFEHDIDYSLELTYKNSRWFLLGRKAENYAVKNENTGDQSLTLLNDTLTISGTNSEVSLLSLKNSKFTDSGSFTYLTNSSYDLGLGYTTDQGAYKLQVNGNMLLNGGLTFTAATGSKILMFDIEGTPVTPGTGYGAFYVNTQKPYYISELGTIYDLTASGGDMYLGTAQTNTAAKSFNSGTFKLNGSTSGTSTLNAAAAAGTTTLTLQGITGTIYSTGGADITVSDGGTGLSSSTPYALFTGGTSSTSAHQQVSGLGTAGQTLVSNGASALPTWQTANTAAGWTLSGNYINMADITDQVRIGDASATGTWDLYVSGSTRSGGLNNTGVITSTDYILSNEYMIADYFTTPNASSTPTSVLDEGMFYSKTDNKAYFNANNVEFDLTNTVEKFRTIAVNTTLATTDKIIFSSAGGITITYPTVPSGKIYTIRNISASYITIPSYVILGANTTNNTVAAYSCVTVCYTGLLWYQID